MKVVAVYTKNGRVAGCDMKLLGTVYVPCSKCIQIHCPMSMVEVRNIESPAEVQARYNAKQAGV